MRNGNVLKNRVSEIHVKRTRINQEVGVLSKVISDPLQTTVQPQKH